MHYKIPIRSTQSKIFIKNRLQICKIHIEKKMLKILHQNRFLPRWQAILNAFDFNIEYIKGSDNSIPDFLTCEFLQCHHGKQKGQVED
jgi:hypothetical protein